MPSTITTLHAGTTNTGGATFAKQLFAWGDNTYGQIGDGTLNDALVPVKALGTGYKQLSTNCNNPCFGAVMDTGALYTWGINTNGELGLGDTANRSVPTQVGTAIDWQQVDFGQTSGYFLKQSGILWASGRGLNGELGNGAASNFNSPVQVVGSNYAQVQGTYQAACAIKTDGTLWSWGANARGECAQPFPTANISSPLQVGTDTSWKQLAGGSQFFIALKTNGTIWGWGNGGNYALGNNLITDQYSPIQIGSATNWVYVAAGNSRGFAINSLGELWGWGANIGGELGIGNNNIQTIPIKVGTDTNWTKVVTGTNNSAGLKSDNTVWTWGSFTATDQPLVTVYDTPQQEFFKSTNWANLGVTAQTTYGIKKTNNLAPQYPLWVWGLNTSGSFGNGTTASSFYPKITFSTDNSDLPQDGSGSFGLRDYKGGIQVYGSNTAGQLGLGDLTNRSSPTQLSGGNTWNKSSIRLASAFISKNGKLYTTGLNSSGQLGLGDTTNRSTLTQVGTKSNWSYVSSAATFMIGIDKNFTMWSWGDNTYGQLGLGDTTNRSSPVQTGASNVWQIVIANTFGFAIALRRDGTLWSTGLNSFGQLGLGDTTDRSNWTQIGVANDWFDIFPLYSATAATKNNGDCYVWGRNNVAQLGLGDITNHSSPVQLPGSWSKLAYSGASSAGLKTDGRLFTWGQNSSNGLQLANRYKFIYIQLTPEETIYADNQYLDIGTSANNYTVKRTYIVPTSTTTPTPPQLMAMSGGATTNALILARNFSTNDCSTVIQIPNGQPFYGYGFFYGLAYSDSLNLWVISTAATANKFFNTSDAYGAWTPIGITGDGATAFNELSYGVQFNGTPTFSAISNATRVRYSNDGTNWSLSTIPVNAKTICYVDGSFYLFINGSDRVWSSQDGGTFNPYGYTGFNTDGFNPVASAAGNDGSNSCLVVTGYNTDKYYYQSFTGGGPFAWYFFSCNIGVTGNWESVVYTSGTTFITADSSVARIAVINGICASPTIKSTPAAFIRLGYCGSRLYGFVYNSATVYYSDDLGTSWSTYSMQGPGQWLAVGNKKITATPTSTTTPTPFCTTVTQLTNDWNVVLFDANNYGVSNKAMTITGNAGEHPIQFTVTCNNTCIVIIVQFASNTPPFKISKNGVPQVSPIAVGTYSYNYLTIGDTITIDTIASAAGTYNGDLIFDVSVNTCPSTTTTSTSSSSTSTSSTTQTTSSSSTTTSTTTTCCPTLNIVSSAAGGARNIVHDSVLNQSLRVNGTLQYVSSNDGVSWTSSSSGIASAGGQMVTADLFRVSGTTYYILGGSDGLWSKTNISGTYSRPTGGPTTGQVYVAAGPDRAICANTSGTNNYYYTTDGVNWTLAAKPGANTSYIVSYANGLFFLCGSTTATFHYSSDGINWTAGTFTNTSQTIDTGAIRYFNGQYYRGGLLGTANSWSRSTDLITWTSIAQNFGGAVRWFGTKGTCQICTTRDAAAGILWYSTNGTTYTAAVTNQNRCYGGATTNDGTLIITGTDGGLAYVVDCV